MTEWLYLGIVFAVFAVLAVLCLRDVDRCVDRANMLDLVNEYVMHGNDGWCETLEDIRDLPEVA